MAYHWTDNAAEIEALAKQADAIEVAGCADYGDVIERCDGEPADFYSVYFHFTPKWDNDPNGLQGAMCIADRDTVGEARALAVVLGAQYLLPVNDYAGAGV